MNVLTPDNVESLVVEVVIQVSPINNNTNSNLYNVNNNNIIN